MLLVFDVAWLEGSGVGLMVYERLHSKEKRLLRRGLV